MEKEIRWFTITSFVFFGMIIGAIIGVNNAPERIKVIERGGSEAYMKDVQFIETLKVCNAISMSVSNQLRDCKEQQSNVSE